jgi:8-oxo-dGTP diphosphatase
MNEQCYYRISIKGIVIDAAGRILLSREDTNKWELLGGGLNHNEDPLDCLRREVAEESGLEITYISPYPKYVTTSLRENSAPQTYIANVIYEIKLNNFDFTPSSECQELRFFSIEEMGTVELFPNVVKLLEVLKKQQV